MNRTSVSLASYVRAGWRRGPASMARPMAPTNTRPAATTQNTATVRESIASFSTRTKTNHVECPRRDSRKMDKSFIGMTGGQIFHEMMRRQNVQHIFGYPGGAILPVFDAIYNSKHLNFILPKHEQGAGHMAQGYARASGKPGVVLVTSGPGATNVITPMADALADGVPLVVFSGQVRTTAIGSDAFQEADVLGISRGCTKWNTMVRNVAELPKRINEAFEIATSGRPGPVLVDLPSDVTASVLRRAIPMQLSLPRAARAMQRNDGYLDGALQRAAHLINNAKSPVIYAGHGVVCSKHAPALLKELADKSSIPVTTSLHGLGAFDELDDKALHMLGMHGSGYANMAVQNADVIIALGGRFDERVTCNVAMFAPKAREAEKRGKGGIIHFEIMPKNINKVVQATEAIEGDVGANLELLLPHIKTRTIEDRQQWHDQISEWKKKWPLSEYDKSDDSGLIKPQALIEELCNLTAHDKANTYVTTGVGQHQMWAAQHFRWRHPRTMISSGGLGTMGFGLPAAIGAQVAHPDALVIDIDGDASLAMTLAELSTAAQFNIGVKVIVLNNEEQGMITQWQNLFYEDRYAHCHQMNPDFVRLAEAMGLQARRLSKPEEMRTSLEWLVSTQGPALLEVMTEKKVPVLPMVPGGKGLDEFISWDGERDRERKKRMRERTGGRYG